MRSASYQRSHNEFPCIFCGSNDETVVGHHVRIAGTCGAGLKPSDIQVIPVCSNDHERCHSGAYGIERQTEKLLQYWLHRLTEKHGMAKALEKMGAAVWDELQ